MVLPNQLTILRILLTPLFLFFFLQEEPLFIQIAFVIFIIASLTDWYDGWLARKFNYITNWGRIWDPLADKILTLSAFIGFAILGILPFWMVALILLRDITITVLRAYADYKNFSFPTSNYAKVKTFFQMAFLYYLIAVFAGSFTAGLYNGNERLFAFLLNDMFIYYAMLLITIITLHSGITYIYQNRFLIMRLLQREA
jgi:CDP-diacylglycerol---glycerol-3-phosphate 3-phosphatidyltransferase